MRWLGGAAIYFLLVFAAGFALGTLRTLVLIPLLGPWPALAIEAPLMLIVSFVACGVAVRWAGVSRRLGARLAMGAGYFVLLMLAEGAVGMGLLSQSPAAYIAYLGSALGAAGLALQALTALFPLIVRRR